MNLCRDHPAGYFCGDGINRPDCIIQCNPNSGSDADYWVVIGDCRANEYCWQDGKGQAFCRS
jgi:hypothetical protein